MVGRSIVSISNLGSDISAIDLPTVLYILHKFKAVNITHGSLYNFSVDSQLYIDRYHVAHIYPYFNEIFQILLEKAVNNDNTVLWFVLQ